MATDASNVRVAVSGAILKGATSATAPTGTSGSPVGFDDLGYISDEGVEISLPDAGDAEVTHAWQNGDTVRIIRTPSDDNPTWVFEMLEEKKETVETYFGVTIDDDDGSFEYVSTAPRPANSYIVDSIDGADLTRDYIPQGVVTSVDSHTLQSTSVKKYKVTVEGEFSAAKGYNFKRWTSSLVVTP